ncbi:hypothetical protein K461DRAFT_290912 [Myriangium duriaei CBS 260.36]|uniref:Rhodopsin domain-containing protein n=1 Tax=Myriangium duriaei CBS 260.36 TaxID=1168546 RepID=A0A9P4MK57_9PEZI|nr:hypothetical protein K461DRAFT_290912 [Myriangium duriaei CBS 260.36]
MNWIYHGSPELEQQSRYPMIIGSAFVTMVLMVVTVILRGYVRLKVVKSPGYDDLLILTSALTSLVYTAGEVVQTRYGLGLPVDKYPVESSLMAKKLNYIFRPFYCLSVSSWKVALCYSYLRITDRMPTRGYKQVIYGSMWFTLGFTIFYTLTVAFACNPVHKYWYPNAPGFCLPSPMVYYIPALITMVIDVLLFFLPIPLVLKLRMDPKRKCGLVVAFLLGLVTTICSLMRLIGSFQVHYRGDPEYLLMWGVAEMNVGIITTSLPTLAPLLKRSTWTPSQPVAVNGYSMQPTSVSARLQSLVRRPDRAKISSLRAHPQSTHPFTPSITQDSHENILGTTKTGRSGSDAFAEKGGSQWPDDLVHAAFPHLSMTTDVDVSTSKRKGIKVRSNDTVNG